MKLWIIHSLLAGIFLALMSLILIRLSEKYNEIIVLFFIFLFGTFFYFTTITFKNYKINLTRYDILLLFIAAFLSFIANIFSLKANVEAPNPGYASVMSRFSNVLLLLFLSLLFLNRELNLIKLIGVVIILIGALILSI